ncbi:MAG: hypothetical protein GY765_15755, partial [bacterium]|nr:hypothetical protein [bacterium]
KEIKGKKYDVVYIYNDNKNWAKYFINKETLLVDYEEALGQAGAITRTVKSDFQTVAPGISYPMKSEIFSKEKSMLQISVKKVEINLKKVDQSLFSFEEKK